MWHHIWDHGYWLLFTGLRTLACLSDAFDEHMEVTRFCDQENFDLVALNGKLAGLLGWWIFQSDYLSKWEPMNDALWILVPTIFRLIASIPQEKSNYEPWWTWQLNSAISGSSMLAFLTLILSFHSGSLRALWSVLVRVLHMIAEDDSSLCRCRRNGLVGCLTRQQDP